MAAGSHSGSRKMESTRVYLAAVTASQPEPRPLHAHRIEAATPDCRPAAVIRVFNATNPLFPIWYQDKATAFHPESQTVRIELLSFSVGSWSITERTKRP